MASWIYKRMRAIPADPAHSLGETFSLPERTAYASVTSALAGIGLILTALYPAAAQENRNWEEIVGAARGQKGLFQRLGWRSTDQRVHRRIGDLASKRHGVTVEQVKLKETAEAVTRVVAEKTAGPKQRRKRRPDLDQRPELPDDEGKGPSVRPLCGKAAELALR
jgi:hypothetical protein